MRKSFLISIIVLGLVLAGCRPGDSGSSPITGDQPKTPPELIFVYQGISIEPVLGMNQ